MAWALSGGRTGQVIRLDICERISCQNRQLRVEADIQPSPGETVRRPPERGEETERSPGGGERLTRGTVGAQSSQHTSVTHQSTDREREKRREEEEP